MYPSHLLWLRLPAKTISILSHKDMSFIRLYGLKYLSLLENVQDIMSRYVNPFTDIGFKVIFGQPASKDLLIILLNELLAGEHHITDLTFLDKEDHADNVSDKGIIYDLYCRTTTDEFIIVEMQNR